MHFGQEVQQSVTHSNLFPTKLGTEKILSLRQLEELVCRAFCLTAQGPVPKYLQILITRGVHPKCTLVVVIEV